ncbi:amino acid ABC transporter substrate-binding protein [Bombilactobacillus folatiphilus]|uniref:Amino acid ABC transporter substrate-binding protein n=1 Tax=Bombilactobacillus folatiphilus TaxID=2923362 RepID=A0ABY4PAC3_9LACO|nr:amino acid ABC transporter substrate-binding protein [Bombilactobacillus folatiphilus]UQS82698.1 amino acid ABC transporter substrate-binding protein [Bombilactobacillus folatiphilus]
MKKQRLLLLFMSLFCLVLMGCNHQQQRIGTKKSTLIVGLDDSYVPMGFVKKSGQLTGFDVDLAKLVGQKIHRKIVFQPIDWSMKETELRNGTIDLIWNGYTKTPQRAQKVAFSQPYLKDSQVVVVKRSSNIHNMQQLKGKVVGTQAGSSGYSALMGHPQLLKNRIKNRTPVLYDNIENGFLDLKAGRIEGFLFDRVFADYYLAHSKDRKQFVTLTTDFSGESFAIGMRKNDSSTRQEINSALNQLRQNGQLKKLSQKWFQHDISK